MLFTPDSALYQTQADLTASQYGIPTGLFRSLISVESSWNPGAVSSAGATGLTQVMPATAAAYGVSMDSLRASPQVQLDTGARILADNYKATGNWEDALAYYNAGNAYKKGVGYDYAQKVLGGAGMATNADGTKKSWIDQISDEISDGLSGAFDKVSSAAGEKIKAFLMPALLVIIAMLLISGGIWKGIK